MTEKEKRDQGQIYDANHDPELKNELFSAMDLCFEYNQTRPGDHEKKTWLLNRILGKSGKNINIFPPFWCDYGYNVEVGDNFFANHNCVILDAAKVTFGDNVFIAPDCGFYTAGHPIDVARRNAGLEYAYPITVGDNVWIGGGVKVMPGVTIGSNTVIGGGSVVVSDIPDGVIAVGNPCHVIRKLTEEEINPSLTDDTRLGNPRNPSSTDDTRLGNPRKPEGEAGAAMLARMNESHGPVTEWALGFLNPEGAGQILDIGCGGGATIGRLARLAPEAKVTGVDYSPVSVQESRDYNKAAIEADKVEVIEASVEELPFADNTFDRITTVESFYFWPDPEENLKEVRRVLKSGGHFYLIADIYGKAGLDQAVLDNIELYDLFNPSKEEFIILFRNAGFTAVKIHVKDGTDWICVEGIK